MTLWPTWRGARMALVLSLLPLAACSCDDDQLTTTPPDMCGVETLVSLSMTCEMGMEYRRGECRAARCQTDGDCCPGQRCNAAAGFCADQIRACTQNAECGEVPGHECIDFRGGRFCGYPNAGNSLSSLGTQVCLSNADCAAGRSCFNTRCVTTAPCDGGCEAGTVCEVDSNSCYELPVDEAASEGCDVECGTGEMLVVADPDLRTGSVCCRLLCACETLPPIPEGQFGWFASLGMTTEDIYVSAYDPGYGDLVVARFDLEGVRRSVEYVDGFPPMGEVTGDPNGPRAGRFDPGPNVGEHTALVVDAANVVHIAYYDRTGGQLKYASLSGGLWSLHVVDNDGDSGLYTSIRIGADGNPRISYMMAEGTVGGDPTTMTALKLATASTNLPTSSADWTVEVIDSRIKPEPVCGGGCARGQECVDLGGGPACQATTVGCGGCMGSEACVDVGAGVTECVETVNAVQIDDLIEGTGLFSSLVLTGTTTLIAYYDRLDGDLRLARSAPSGWVLRTLDGDDPMAPTDVGQHPSIAVASDGTVGIAYVDATSDDLIYLDLGTRDRQIVDNGINAPDVKFVGADASLSFDDRDRPVIAYQDATEIDLVYARRLGSPGMWSNEIIRGDPDPGEDIGTASGFYASQQVRDDRAFIGSVDVSFSEDSILLLTLTVQSKLLD